MKKQLFLFFLMWNVFTLTNAQPNFNWVGTLGNADENLTEINNLAIDKSNNVISSGIFRGSIDLDPTSGVQTSSTTQSTGTDAFIVKQNVLGDFLWAVQFEGPGNILITGIDVDSTKNVYVGGFFTNTTDFDPGAGVVNLTPTNLDDGFVLKLDSNGAFVWVKQFSSSSRVRIKCMDVDLDGNVLLGGIHFAGTVDLDPGTGVVNATTTSTFEGFVVKLDKNGDYIQSSTFETSSSSEVRDVYIEVNGNMIVAGIYYNTIDLDPKSGIDNYTSNGSADVFIVRLDASGNKLWAASIGGIYAEDVNAIELNVNTNELLIGGSFGDNVDFDPSAGSAVLTNFGANGLDAYLLNLNTVNGNFNWVKQFGGTEGDDIKNISIDENGFIALTVYSSSTTVDLDPSAASANFTLNGTSSSTNHDAYLAVLNSNGEYLWAQQYGSTKDDGGYGVKFDKNKNIVLTGHYNLTIDFDAGIGTSNLTSQGLSDYFLLSVKKCLPTSSSININACGSYTSPSKKYVWTTSNTYKDTIINRLGCDSIITINLTVNSIPSAATTLSGSTITATNTTATYHWLDCSNNYAEILNETNQTFTATASGSYAVKVTENGCVDTSACVSITVTGVIENTFKNQLQVYPNPTNSDLTIELGETVDNLKVEITTIEGIVVSNKNFNYSTKINFDIYGPSGIYLVKLTGDKNQNAVLRVIKK